MRDTSLPAPATIHIKSPDGTVHELGELKGEAFPVKQGTTKPRSRDFPVGHILTEPGHYDIFFNYDVPDSKKGATLVFHKLLIRN